MKYKCPNGCKAKFLVRVRAFVDVIGTADGFLEEETARFYEIDYDTPQYRWWATCLICGELADEIYWSSKWLS